MRDGDDLVTAVDVAAPLAALGTTVTVPTLEGAVELEIPAGTQPHETLIVRGAGHAGAPRAPPRRPAGRRQRRHPAPPEREQRELLEQLADSLTERQPAHATRACSAS